MMIGFQTAILVVIRVLIGIFVVMAVGSVVLSYLETLRLQEVISCQSKFNEEFRGAVLIRDSLQEDVQMAQRRLLVESAKPGATDPGVIQNYLDVLEHVEERLAANPLPQNYCSQSSWWW